MSEPKLTIGTSWQFGSPVVAVAFDRKGVGAFACGDGTLRLLVGDQEPQVHQVHDGAILSLDIHPTEGFLTGGDDGRLVCSGAGGASIELFSQKGKWIESISASEASGLIACTAGKDAVLIDGGKQTRFTHETTATGVAFDPKGRRLAVSHYNGVSLWWARSASQATTVLNWKGSHLGVVWSPDGRFVISTMQETALHGWRVEDAADMKMSGYPTRIKSFVWDHRGKMLMTSGASMIVGWPFTGRSGPMGKEPFRSGQTGTPTCG